MDGRLELSRPKRGSSDLFRAYHVIVDGVDVGVVRRGQSQVFQVAPGQHEVHLEIDWARSPSLTVDVAPEAIVRLACWPNFPAWRAQQALANPSGWIHFVRCAEGD